MSSSAASTSPSPVATIKRENDEDELQMLGTTSKRQKTTKPTEELLEVVDAAKDGQGDLFIKVGPPTSAVIIRTHSALLKLTSPVFKAMLGPKFAEGAAVYTEDEPLCLQDDDPTSFTLLCTVLHHQYETLRDLGQLTGLAVIADKYQCAQAVRPYFSSLVSPILTSDCFHTEGTAEIVRKGLSLENAMCVSHVLGDAQLLWRTSKRLIATIDATTVEAAVPKALLEVLPETFIENVRRTQSNQQDGIVEKLRQSVPDFFNGLLEYAGTSLRSPCETGARRVGTIQHYLWQWETGNNKAFSPNKTLQNTWEIVLKIAGYCSTITTASECRTYCQRCPLWRPEEVLREIVAQSKTSFMGMCLECERGGVLSGVSGKCGHVVST